MEYQSHLPHDRVSESRPGLGGHLSRYLVRHLKDQSTVEADDVALLARNFWLTPAAVPDIASEPQVVTAAIRQIRRCASAAPYLVEYRRAAAERKRASAIARFERTSVRTAVHASASSSFEREAVASARCIRIQAAAANLWMKIERRPNQRASAASRIPVQRPRARRSHRVVARAAKASGDSGDSDGEPPRSRAAGIGTACKVTSAEVV